MRGNQLQDIPPEERNCPIPPPWQTLTNLTVDMVTLEKPKAEYSQEELKTRALAKIDTIAADYTVYTDGSTNGQQENGGAGVFAMDANNNTIHEDAKPAGRLCSSYAGECAALYHALDWMESIVKDNTTEERLRFLVYARIADHCVTHSKTSRGRTEISEY